jgi:photosystem II stability/assembly factor-like uncharacterized protein
LSPAVCGLVIAWLAPPAPAGRAEGGDDPAGSARTLQPQDLKTLKWRSIGPANMGGRLAAIALAPGNPKTYFVGYGTGGLFKTTNNGTTFSPVFDDRETSSIGSIVVCDAPPGWHRREGQEPGEQEEQEKADRPDDNGKEAKGRIVWVGTGEANGRNSSSWGNGVYRSTDGGDTFEHLGLSESHDIPALAVDPRDPDVCFVAALGHLWGPNDERGVYKTSDGGRTWRPVLQIDRDTGACDVILDPDDPDTVYAAMYMRRRTPHSFQSGGPEGGVYRSSDGGATWTKLTGGLPGQTGRIGLDICRRDPKILCAVIESDEGGWIGSPFNNRLRGGGVFRSTDGGDTWTRMSDFNPRAFYFSRIRIDPHDDQRVYLLGWGLYISDDGGRTFRAGAAKVAHVDFQAMAIDPDDTDHLLVGTDGGLYVSYDGGRTWDFHDHMAVGQFYNVAVDLSDPYRVGGGLQDNGTWIGPSETLTQSDDDYMGRKGAITNHDWQFIMNGDGFHVAFDPADPNIVYAEWQGGNLGRIHLDTGEQRNLRPSPKEGQARFRFNWNAPFFISPHEPTTLYLGGNFVFRLTERGDRWRRISGDLSSRDPAKIMAVGSAAETAGTVVSLAESPLEPGLLWAGTDDGLIHVTLDAGTTWANVTPPAVNGLYVSRIEPSHHDRDTAYVAVDGHRSDVFDPILLMTADAGKTWTSAAGDLPPDAPPEVVREDLRNPNVLYVGTEHAAYVTIDRGEHWVKLNNETLPTVAVDDLVIHPREHDLVAGTHGRSIYVLDDISPLSQLTPDIVQSEFHVFAPLPARPRYHLDYGGLWSDRMFIAQNPPMGAVISYWIRAYAGDEVKITISTNSGPAAIAGGAGEQGHVLRKLTGTNGPGLNRVIWDLKAEKDQRLGNPHELPEFVPAGTYTVDVSYGMRKMSTTVEVLPRPESAISAVSIAP